MQSDTTHDGSHFNCAHRIPLHLEQTDHFLLSFTARQLLILGLGLTFGYLVGTSFDLSTPGGLVLGAICFFVAMAAAAVFAFVHIRKRDLETWLVVVFLYMTTPRYWIFHQEQEAFVDPIPPKKHHVKEETHLWH